MSNKIYKKRGFFLLFFILALVIVFSITILNTKSGKFVKISRDGEELERISLDEDGTYQFEDGEELNTLVIKNNEADVISANCKNQVCVNTAPISEVGEVIACLPHGLIFEITE